MSKVILFFVFVFQNNSFILVFVLNMIFYLGKWKVWAYDFY